MSNTIKLTESDLHSIIKEAVESILNENDTLEEGFWDGARSFVGQYGRRGANAIQKGAERVGNAVQRGANAVKRGAQNVGDAVARGYNNVKADIEQTAQNARQDSSMKDMQKAFANFKSAVEKFKNNGGTVNNQLASRISGIEKMMSNYQSHF